MLTLGKVSPANAGYYQSAVVAGMEDYYGGEADAVGRWIGRCDLVGAVAGDFATSVEAGLLLEARCAPDGSSLSVTAVSERSVTAFDLTFSAPKSVSVLYALGDPDVIDAVEAAHTAAVVQAVASMSPRIACTRTGRAGAAVVDAEGVFGIRYRHRTSRALDPQLHDHVLISNAVRTVSDGRWRTLDARGLYRNAKAAGVEYQTHLRAGLSASLGVEFGDVDQNGQADIVGIDQTLLDEFSTRGTDIETTLARWVEEFVDRVGRRPTPAEVGRAHKTITLSTRSAKHDAAEQPTATLRALWRDRVSRLGLDANRMIRSACARVRSPGVIARPDAADVLDALETRHAEWSEAQLLEQIAMRTSGPDPATIADTIEAVRAEVMSSASVVDLSPPDEHDTVTRSSDGRPVELPPSAVRYTTSGHLRREVEILDWATARSGGQHRSLTPGPELLDGLDASQVAAVTTMLETTRPVVAVVGPAGSGKTRMLAAAVDAWRLAGVPVFGLAPSATSAQQLSTGAGMSADTIHKLAYEHHTKWTEHRQLPDPEWVLPAGSVVVIDEAGMADTGLLHRYACLAQRNRWRTILVGDHRQLDAVGPGGMFAELVEHPDVPTVELDILHRFVHAWEADATLQLRAGDTSVVDLYERNHRIHDHASSADAVEALSEVAVAGIQAGRDTLVMASTNATVDELNDSITCRLIAACRVDPAPIEIAGRTFHRHQVGITRSNDRTLAYGPDQREWVRNGDRWLIESGGADYLVLANLENSHRCLVPSAYVSDGNLQIGYASTVHRAQGATVDDAHLLIDQRTNAEHLYVGLSRGRYSNHAHSTPLELDPEHHGPPQHADEWTPRDHLIAALQRQPRRTSALASRRQLRHDLSGLNVSYDVGPDDQVAVDAGRPAAARRRLARLGRLSQPSTLQR